MKIILIIVINLILLLINIDANAKNLHTSSAPAQNCQTLNCVRNHIDIIDREIVQLIGKRLAYVKRAGEIKGHNRPIHDQTRENKILLEVGEKAEKSGYSRIIAINIYKTILAQSNIYESQATSLMPLEKPK